MKFLILAVFFRSTPTHHRLSPHNQPVVVVLAVVDPDEI